MKIEELGKLLKEYRKRNNMEVKEVRKIFLDDYQIKVSEKTIYNWESSQYNISTPKLLAICEIYDIKDLTTLPNESEEDKSGIRISPKEQKLIKAYRENIDLQHAIDKILNI